MARAQTTPKATSPSTSEPVSTTPAPGADSSAPAKQAEAAGENQSGGGLTTETASAIVAAPPTEPAPASESTPPAPDTEPEPAPDAEPEPVESEYIVLIGIGGTRNGDPWPVIGETISLGEAEASTYLQLGYVAEAE